MNPEQYSQQPEQIQNETVDQEPKPPETPEELGVQVDSQKQQLQNDLGHILAKNQRWCDEQGDQETDSALTANTRAELDKLDQEAQAIVNQTVSQLDQICPEISGASTDESTHRPDDVVAEIQAQEKTPEIARPEREKILESWCNAEQKSDEALAEIMRSDGQTMIHTTTFGGSNLRDGYLLATALRNQRSGKPKWSESHSKALLASEAIHFSWNSLLVHKDNVEYDDNGKKTMKRAYAFVTHPGILMAHSKDMNIPIDESPNRNFAADVAVRGQNDNPNDVGHEINNRLGFYLIREEKVDPKTGQPALTNNPGSIDASEYWSSQLGVIQQEQRPRLFFYSGTNFFDGLKQFKEKYNISSPDMQKFKEELGTVGVEHTSHLAQDGRNDRSLGRGGFLRLKADQVEQAENTQQNISAEEPTEGILERQKQEASSDSISPISPAERPANDTSMELKSSTETDIATPENVLEQEITRTDETSQYHQEELTLDQKIDSLYGEMRELIRKSEQEQNDQSLQDNSIEKVNIGDENYYVRYVKDQLKPFRGNALVDDNLALVDADLPPLVKRFVTAHELYHCRDKKGGGWLAHEVRANLACGLKDPIGFLATAISAIRNGALKEYGGLFSKNGLR